MSQTASLETACRLFAENAKTNPFNTWLIVENEDVRRRAFEILNTPVLETRITTVKTLAHTILSEQNAKIRIIPPEEQYLLFSAFAKEIFGKEAEARTITENLIDLYITVTLNCVECPEDTDKGEKAAELFSRYRTWCRENNAADAITALEYAVPLAEQMKPDVVVCFCLKSLTKQAERLLAAFTKTPITFQTELQTTAESEVIAYRTVREELEQTCEKICRLQETGVSPSDILLLTPALQTTLPLLEEVAAGFWVNKTTPLTFKTTERKSIANIPAIRAVLAFVSAGFRPEETDLQLILDCPHFRIKHRGVTAGILRKAVKITGSTDWRNLQTGDDETLKTVLADILDLASMRQKDARTLRERITALKDDLDALGWTSSPMIPAEHAARTAFLRFLDRISSAGTADKVCRQSDFLLILIRGCRKNAGIPYPENETAFRVAKIRAAAGTKTPYVFIIGITAKSIPNISATLPLLTVQETKTLLPDRYRKTAEETAYYFASALAAAEISCVISYAKTDMGKSNAPSPYLTRIREPADAEVKELCHSIPGSQKSAGYAIAQCQELSDAFGIRDADATAQRISTADPIPEFSEERFREYYQERKKVSPSFLETYAECPFSWYLKYHLRLEQTEDKTSEALRLGNVMHHVLETYFTRHESITLETKDAAYDELAGLIAEGMEKSGIKTPSWKAKLVQYLGESMDESILAGFIEQELAFTKQGYHTDPSWVEREVEADLDGITIAGRVDRVLRKEDGTFFVLDYKTGKVKEDAETALQLPLYSEAVRQMTDGTPKVGQYLQISPETVGISTPFGDSAEEMISYAKERTKEILEAIRSGNCRPNAACDNKYCSFKRVCRKSEGGDDA